MLLPRVFGEWSFIDINHPWHRAINALRDHEFGNLENFLNIACIEGALHDGQSVLFQRSCSLKRELSLLSKMKEWARIKSKCQIEKDGGAEAKSSPQALVPWLFRVG